MKNKGIEIAKFIKNISPDNMYILCKSKISEVGELINSNGALYLDFEKEAMLIPYVDKSFEDIQECIEYLKKLEV